MIQYRPCDDSDSYVHRSGRTGRAGREGTSVIIYSEPEWFKLRRLENDINVCLVLSLPFSSLSIHLINHHLLLVYPSHLLSHLAPSLQ